MRRLRSVIVLSVLLGASAAGAAQGLASARRLVVEVNNGTPNGTTVTGDRVLVQLYRGQMPVGSFEAVVDDSGMAVFDPLPPGQDLVAVVRARHRNMAFGTQPVTLASAGGDVTARVTVFDVSTDSSSLSVGVHHVIVAMQSGSLEFTEHLQLKNSSGLAVIGSKRDSQKRPMVIEIDLPDGFRDLKALEYLEQHALVTTETGVYDTMAVPPGEHRVSFSYRVDVGRSPLAVTKRLSLPTSEVLVFWKGGQGRLEGLGEPDGRLTDDKGAPTEYYRRENLAAGDQISFQIAGLNAKSSDAYVWIVLGAVFAVVTVIAVMRLRSGPA